MSEDRRPLAILCDFDGTITTRDIGATLCERFAPGVLEQMNEEWRAGRRSFADASLGAWRSLRATREQLVACALEAAIVREGFDDFLDACDEAGARVIIASAGLDLYVRPVLERHLGARIMGLEMHVNEAHDTGAGIDVRFPHRHADCLECSLCKGLHAREVRAQGYDVVGVGDSWSDRCLAEEADFVHARDWLAEHCRERGLAHATWETFAEVALHVRTRGARRAPG